MIFVNAELNIELMFKENQINVLVIESPEVLTRLAGDIWMQVTGLTGSWILSEESKELNIVKTIECVYNPFTIDFNNKKVINAIYKKLTSIANDELFIETTKLNSHIMQFLEKLTYYESCELEYNLDLDVSGLMKVFNVKVSEHSGVLVEKVVEYIKLMSRVCDIKVFVFLNFKQFLTSDELLRLYKECVYEKVNLLLIENANTPLLEYEKKIIIDRDLCLIEL